MGDASQPPSGSDRRPGLAIGLAIVVAMIAGKSIEKLLVPSLGEWPAFGVSLLASAAAAALIGLAVYMFIGGPAGRP